LNWSGSGTGADWVVDRFGAVGAQDRGNFGLRIRTRVTTPAVGDFVQAMRFTSLRRWRNITFSCSFRQPNGIGIDKIYFLLNYMNGVKTIRGDIRYSYFDEAWSFRNVSDVWEVIPGSSQKLGDDSWHYFSVVIDYVNNKLKIFQCDEVYIERLERTFCELPTMAPNYFYVAMGMITSVASQQTMYYDDVLVQEVA